MKTSRFNLLIVALFSSLLISCSKVSVTATDAYEVVHFPDGSTAYLNKNSSIEYDKAFSERRVTQTGEVFYDVKKGSNPFVVETASGEVKVLGTKFNVDSSEDELEVEVESGSVELKTRKLAKKIKKGQKAVCKEVEKDIKLVKAELKHKKWMSQLKKDFKKLGKEINKESKELKKDSEKFGKDVKKEFKKLKKKLNKQD